jgi:RNA polymerase sigma factor (TIGR02999 family)
MDPAGEDLTHLLRLWSEGDRGVESRLFSLVLPELRQIARRLMRGERQDHSLQPTALLNEAYVRLLGARERQWSDRRHFFAMAARAMRHILIDHARARQKGVKTPLDGFEDLLRGRDEQLETALSIGGLLDELQEIEPEWCAIIDLKYFAGFTDDETAEALEMPVRSMQRKFGDARRWLFERMGSQ